MNDSAGSLNRRPPVVSLAMEAIGDITASAEVSRVEVEGEDFESRIQGGVLVGLTPVSSRRVSKHRRISE